MPRAFRLSQCLPDADQRRREIADTSENRRRLAPVRTVVVSAIALLLHLGLGWAWAWLWAGAFCAAVAAEPLLVRRVLARPVVSAAGFAAVLAMYAVVATVYASVGVALWMGDVPDGKVGAVLLLAGTLVNIGLVSRTSRWTFAASTAPYVLLFFAAPAWLLATGRAGPVEPFLMLGGALLIGQTVAAWRDLSAAQLSEARARLELDARRAEAEAATAAKSAFIAAVSHELRTPLSGLLAAATELKRRTVDAEQAACAEVVADSARFMRTLLNDLLDLAKLDAGRMQVETLTFDPGLFLHEVQRFWAVEAAKRGVPLQLTAATSLPDRVGGDPTRLRQVLNNLLSNALKFTGSEGVRWSVDVTAVAGGRQLLTVQVRDTGPGLTDVAMARLFEPFHQGEASVARTHGGTGLGLAISRELARLMGGDLTAESRPGEGAVFTLTAVLATVAASTPAGAATAPAPASPGLRVLVADDHEIGRRTLGLLLEPTGAEVTFAADGLEALERAAQGAFDLILLDFHMPRLDGPAALRRLRAEPGPNQGAPVLAVTGAESGGAEAFIAAGAQGCIAKPLTAQALYDAVESCLAPPKAAPVPLSA